MGPFFPMLKAVAARQDLSMPAKMVHACLTGYSAMGRAYPSQARIASDLGISSRTVYRAVKELEGAGLVSVQRRPMGVSLRYALKPTRDPLSIDKESTDNGSLPPQTTSQYHHGQVGELIERRDSSNRGVARDAETMTHAERLEWLRETLGNFAQSLGKPDTAILRKIEAATAGATEDDIEAALHRLYASGLQNRMRSWGLMVKALPDELGKVTL